MSVAICMRNVTMVLLMNFISPSGIVSISLAMYFGIYDMCANDYCNIEKKLTDTSYYKNKTVSFLSQNVNLDLHAKSSVH